MKFGSEEDMAVVLDLAGLIVSCAGDVVFSILSVVSVRLANL